MNKKLMIPTLILVLAFALSACAPAGGSAQMPTRTMTVTGNGLITLKPDVAYINIGVHTESAMAADAVASNNAQTARVLETLKNFGVQEADIRTTNFTIWPSQQYLDDGQGGQTVVTTYMVDNIVYVTVRDLTKLGDLLDASVKAGANSINSIQFDLADKTEALVEARKAAVENAKKQATELADASGVRLGDITYISYYDSMPTPLLDFGGKGGGMAEGASVPVSAGQLQITVSVTLTYEIK